MPGKKVVYRGLSHRWELTGSSLVSDLVPVKEFTPLSGLQDVLVPSSLLTNEGSFLGLLGLIPENLIFRELNFFKTYFLELL